MKLKKLFSLSLAAAMLLSTAALPVAAVDTSTIVPYFNNFENATNVNFGDGACVIVDRNNVNVSTYKNDAYTVEEGATKRKDFGKSAIIEQQAGKSDTGALNLDWSFNENTEAVVGLSAYSNGGNSFRFGFCGAKGTTTAAEGSTKYTEEWNNGLNNVINVEKGKETHSETTIANGWHDYAIGINLKDKKANIYIDGKLIRTIDQSASTDEWVMKVLTRGSAQLNTLNTAAEGQPANTSAQTVAFDDLYLYGKQDEAKLTGETSVSSTATSYSVNMGQKVFLPSDSELTSIADAVKIYQGEGESKTALEGVTASWTNDTWKDVVTLSNLSLEPDTTYTVEVSGVIDAFGTAVDKTLTFSTESLYNVTLKSSDAQFGTVEFVDENGDTVSAPADKYAAGTKIYAKATPNKGYLFTGWKSDNTWTASDNKTYYDTMYESGKSDVKADAFADGSWMQNPITYTLPEKAVTLTAQFQAENSGYYYDGTVEPDKNKSMYINGAKWSVVDDPEENGSHGKVLKVADESIQAFLCTKIQNAREAVFGYSFYVPGSSTATGTVAADFKSGGNVNGMSGKWKKDQFGIFCGVDTPTNESTPKFYSATNNNRGEIIRKYWEYDGEAKESKLTVGWHDVVVAIRNSEKKVDFYIDNQYLSTAYNEYFTGLSYLNLNAGEEKTNYFDDIFLYYPEDAEAPTGNAIVTKDTSEYVVDMGQKVTYAGDTVPGEIYLGGTKVSTDVAIERGTTSDRLKFTMETPLTPGTYSVSFDGLTDLLGNKITSRVGFTVVEDPANVVNMTFNPGEGGKIRLTTGSGDNKTATDITSANNVIPMEVGKEITIEAIPNDGYVMKDEGWSGLTEAMLEKEPPIKSGNENGDHRKCSPKLTIVVPDTATTIGLSFHKVENPAPQYYSLTTTDSVKEFKKLTGNSDKVAFDSDALSAKATDEFNVNIDTNKNIVFGFSVKKQKDASSYKLQFQPKSDNPCRRWGTVADKYVGGLFTIFDNKNLTDTQWQEVCFVIDFKEHKTTYWINGTKSEITNPDTFEFMSRIMVKGNGYDFKDLYFYYPDEATGVSAPSEVETHTTEYVIDMGQKVFANTTETGYKVSDMVSLSWDGEGSLKKEATNVTDADYKVELVSDGYKDQIKLTFLKDSVLQDGNTYTVDLSGVTNAYKTDKPFGENVAFSVKAKQQKVTVESANTKMGTVQSMIVGSDVTFENGKTYTEGTKICANITPSDGYEFVGWECGDLTKGSDAMNLSQGTYAEDENSHALTFVVPWDKEVNVKAIFKVKAEKEDKTIDPYYYDFEDFTAATTSGVYKNVSAEKNSTNVEAVNVDAEHGVSLKNNGNINAMNGKFNTNSNGVFGYSFYLEDASKYLDGTVLQSGLAYHNDHIVGAYEDRWVEPNSVSDLIKVTKSTDKSTGTSNLTITPKDGAATTIGEGWHHFAVSFDYSRRTVKVWLDKKCVSTYTVKDQWYYSERVRTAICDNGVAIDNMFFYREGGNEYAKSVNVKAGDNSWTFDVGEMLYDVTAEVSMNGTAITESQPAIEHVDTYNYKVTLVDTKTKPTWESGNAYTVKITGTDAFGNEVTKTITANATTMYKAEVKSDDKGTATIIENKKDAYAEGETFTVQATVTDANTNSFKDWTVTGEGATVTPDANDATKATVTVGTADVTVTANFQVIPKSEVTTSVNDSTMGTAVAKIWGKNADNAEGWYGEATSIKPGTKVRAAANPNTGYKFKEWQAEGITLTDEQKTTNALVFDMGGTAVTLTAVFEMYDGEVNKSVPFYWDFESTSSEKYGNLNIGTVWADSKGNILTTTRKTDDEHGRAIVFAQTTENNWFNTDTGSQLSEKDWVFGFEAYLTENSAFQINGQGKSGKWESDPAGVDSISGVIAVSNDGKGNVTVKTYEGTRDATKIGTKDSSFTTKTKTLGETDLNQWHKFRIALNYTEHKVSVYMGDELLSTVQMNDGFTNTKRWNIGGIKDTMFDNMFGYYMDDAKLTSDTNIKAETTSSYDITTKQLLNVAANATATLKPTTGDAIENVAVNVTVDKYTSTITLSGLGNKLTQDTEYEVTFTGITDLFGKEIKHSFRTRSTTPTITVTDATTFEGTLPQDTKTDIDIETLNIPAGATLTVTQNGNELQPITIAEDRVNDDKFTTKVEVTLVGGENKFEVKWTDADGNAVTGETTIKARKFNTLSTVMDVDFEDGVPATAFGTKSAPEGTLTVIDGDAEHGKVYEVNYPADAGSGGSPFFTSPGSAKATSGIIVTEADFYFVGDTYTLGIFNTKDNSDKWISQFAVKNGSVTAFGTEVATVQSNTWYRLKHLIDIDNGMIYYFMNGRLLAEHAYQYSDGGAWKDGNGFQYWNQQAGAKGTTFLVDNIKMYRYAETADFTVTGDGGERVSVNGTIYVNFTQEMDATTLAGITVTDESGNAVTTGTATLSDDKKTYSIPVSGLSNNAPYTVTVPETVKTTSGAANAEAKVTIWSEKAGFSIDTATVDNTGKVTVNLNGTTDDAGYIVVYAYAGSKMIDLKTAEVKDGSLTGTLAALDISGAADKTVTYGATLLKGAFDNLKCVDFIKVGEIK